MDNHNTDNNNRQNDSAYNDKYEAFDMSQNNYTADPRSNKQPMTVKASTLVLSIALTVAVVLLAVMAALYFFSFKENATDVSTQMQSTAVLTEAPTEKPTEKPTEAPTKAPEKEKEDNKSSHSRLVTLYPPTYIYSGPSYNHACVMVLDEKGVYTIVDEYYDMSTGLTWGKLKSGVGWINMNNPTQPAPYTPPVTNTFKPYIVTTYPPTYIYAGPGYGYECVMTLDEQGAYTIVEEYYNSSTQSTWGKLKSGVGWIDLG